MVRYYLLSDYLVPVFGEHGAIYPHQQGGGIEEAREFYRLEKVKLPKNYTVLSIEPRLHVRVVFYACDLGHFLISAPDRREAYSLATAIQAVFSLFFGYAPRDDRDTYFLTELNKVPHPSWTEQELLCAVREVEPDFMDPNVWDLRHGVVVGPHEMQLLRQYVRPIHNDPHLNEAITHLNQSLALFYGYMVGSFYSSVYVYQRRGLSHSTMEKQYLENRPRYEVAFLAAFKAIERFLRVNDVKKHKLRSVFDTLPYRNIKYDTPYTRRHEIFSGLAERTTYGDIISHFLDIRNIVAAHANRKPPPRFMISEDSIYEIQLFVSELFSMALSNTTTQN